MKKVFLFSFLLLALTMFLGCTSVKKQSFDGKDRPSSAGSLQVKNGKLSDADGNPVMLRGISNNSVALSEIYVKDQCYDDLSKIMGVNVIRLALYTHGVGSAGYCSGSDWNRDNLYKLLIKSVDLAREKDMYAIVDWHILSDGNPNRYIERSKEFFDKVSKDLNDYDNVIYEICNEPNGEGVDWQCIKEYADVIIPIIRKNDPNSVILVGTPNWSQDIDKVVQNPLSFDNVLYVLHFYSASHKQELRNKLDAAVSAGLPAFVSEFGVTANTGGVPYDFDEADIWINYLEEKGISYVMWNFSKSAEASAALKYSTTKTSGFEYDDFSKSGQWLIDTIKCRSK